MRLRQEIAVLPGPALAGQWESGHRGRRNAGRKWEQKWKRREWRGVLNPISLGPARGPASPHALCCDAETNTCEKRGLAALAECLALHRPGPACTVHPFNSSE